MTYQGDELPPDVAANLMKFIRQRDGEIEVIDREDFLDFIIDNCRRYPALQGLLKVDGDAAMDYYERTGKVPSGIRLIKTTTRDGDNVTELEIIDGVDTSEL